MIECWNPTAEQRPTFSYILEKLTACTQDPEIMNAPVPVYYHTTSSMERDTTVMRPSGNEDYSLQVPNSSDYLIPLSDSRAMAERLMTEATGVTMPDTLSTYTLTNSHKMPETKWGETSFTKPKLCSNDSMEV
jgi:anaplastic lymphoma kinase